MEDLWLIRKSSIEINEFADIAEYKRYLKRFSDSEEKENRNNLLYNYDKESGS